MEGNTRIFQLSIRKARPSDLERVLELEQSSFPFPYNVEMLLELLAVSEDLFLVAEESSRIVGYVVAVVEAFSEGHILSLAVDPEKRREGIGTLLVAAVSDKLRNLGARTISLEVRRNNSAALTFYDALGFSRSGTVPAYYEDGTDAILMKRRLDPISA